MKNKFLLLLILGVTFFASCNDDDDDEKDAIVGTWKIASIQTENDLYVSGPLALNWEVEEGTKLSIFPGYDMEIKDVVAMGEGFANIALVQVLKDITFQNNRQVVATYSDAGVSLDSQASITPNWKTSEPKYLSYKIVSASQLILYLNMNNILAGADIDITSIQLEAEDLQKLMTFVTKVTQEGISVSYVLSESLDKLTITLDKALFDQVMTLLPVLSKLIPSDSDNEMIALIQPILEQIPSVWAKTTKFDVSLKLEK